MINYRGHQFASQYEIDQFTQTQAVRERYQACETRHLAREEKAIA